MNKNLLIDLGNTACKVAFARGKEIGPVFKSDGSAPLSFIQKIVEDRGEVFDVIVFGSVQRYDPQLVAYLKSQTRTLIVVDGDTPTALRIDYAKTPDRLGADLLAAGVGAITQFPGEDLLVVDFGTAITFEAINKEGWLCGLNISPGLQTRFKALHQCTHALPLITLEEGEEVPDYGMDTRGAMISGVVRGIVHEIEGYIHQNRDKRVIFTGGDAIFFAEKLKIPIFADYNLIFTGLAEIAQNHV